MVEIRFTRKYRGCDEADKNSGETPEGLPPPARHPRTPSPYSFGHLKVTMKNV